MVAGSTPARHTTSSGTASGAREDAHAASVGVKLGAGLGAAVPYDEKNTLYTDHSHLSAVGVGRLLRAGTAELDWLMPPG